jgi:hypothetical protein
VNAAARESHLREHIRELKKTQRLADNIIKAGRKVVARWEKGDLAGAVRELDKSLHDYDGKEYKP